MFDSLFRCLIIPYGKRAFRTVVLSSRFYSEEGAARFDLAAAQVGGEKPLILPLGRKQAFSLPRTDEFFVPDRKVGEFFLPVYAHARRALPRGERAEFEKVRAVLSETVNHGAGFIRSLVVVPFVGESAVA